MNKQDLTLIKKVYDDLQKGVVVNTELDKAYKLLSLQDNVLVNKRVKILTVNRFVMMQYETVLKGLEQVFEEETDEITEEDYIARIEELENLKEKAETTSEKRSLSMRLTNLKKSYAKDAGLNTEIDNQQSK